MRNFILGIVATLLVIGCSAFLVINRGWFPIGADNPPGGMERSLANMATDAYVERNAPRQENPVQATAPNLVDGARDYERHCALCHGGAAARISPLRSRFNPPVPQLINRIPHDDDANLWWVTKHGIRLTGMPAWDGLLTDEQLWKIIAFVKHSNALPPEAQAAWHEAAGAGAGGPAPAPAK